MTALFTFDGYELSIEDDGLTCYAFLHKDGKQVGFVWMYNRQAVPLGMTLRRGNPVPNPEPYSSSQPLAVADSDSDFEATCAVRDGTFECAIYVKGILTSVVGDGDNPGWSRNAALDGPAALAL